MSRHPTISALFADDADGPDAELASVLDAFLADIEAGRPADPERLVAEHPSLADRLRAYLPLLGLAGRHGGSAVETWPVHGELALAALGSSVLLPEPPGDGDDDEPIVARLASSTARLGRYQVLGEIARGGMGAVLKARDAELGRDLAVKVLLERHAGNTDVLRRFVEEAQIGGQLQHPGIVPVYELGSDGRRPFLAMKLVKGRTLAALLHDRAAPGADLPRFLQIFEHVCQTVAYAHARGVIHRDLKPSNVMVGSFGEVQVMDWGLAKVLTEGGAADDARTAHEQEQTIQTVRSGSDNGGSSAGSVLGTPAYMAPEQARGETDRLDERCDVFGLGAIICEVLTGAPPYRDSSQAELRRRAAHGDLADARVRLSTYGAEPELVALALACLEPELAARPRNAGEVARRIAAHLAGMQERLRAAEVAQAEAQARAESERARRRLAVGLVATVVVFLSSIAIGLTAGNSALGKANHDIEIALHAQAEERKKAQVSATKAQAEQRRAEANFRMALDAVDEMTMATNDLSPTVSRSLVYKDVAVTMTDKMLSLYNEMLAKHDAAALGSLERAWVRMRSGQIHAFWGREAEATNAYRLAIRDLAELTQGFPAEPRYRHELAKAFLESDQAVRRGFLVLGGNNGLSEAPTDAQRESARAKIVGIRAPYREAIDLLTPLVAAHPTEPDFRHDLARSLVRLASSYHRVASIRGLSRDDLGGWQRDAETNFERGLALYEKLAAERPENPEYQLEWALSEGDFASLLDYGAVRKPTQADQAYGRSVALLEKLAEDFPGDSEFQATLGTRLFQQALAFGNRGKYREAERAHRRAAAILERVQAQDPELRHAWSRMHRLSNRSRVLSGLGAPASDLIQVYDHMARLLEREERTPEAASFYRKYIAAVEQHLKDTPAHPEKAETSPRITGAYIRIGRMFARAGRLADAEVDLRRALSRLANATRESEPMEALMRRGYERDAQTSLGQILQMESRYEEALAAFRRAAEVASPNTPQARQIAAQIQHVERARQLKPRLQAIIRREDRPRDVAETVAFAQLAYDCKCFAGASRLWSDAFASEPKLVGDMRAYHRYNAACSAALAGCGQGKDDPLPDAAAQAKLRGQALDWLKADRAAWAELVETRPPKARPEIVLILHHWKTDHDLARVREPDALVKLPDGERKAWQALWADLDAMLAKLRQGD